MGGDPLPHASLRAIAPESMPQATRVWLEQDRMAHHHQAEVAHGAAHDLQDIRVGQTAQHQVTGLKILVSLKRSGQLETSTKFSER